MRVFSQFFLCGCVFLGGVILAEWGVGAGAGAGRGECWARLGERSQPGTTWISARCSMGEMPTTEIGVRVIVRLFACLRAHAGTCARACKRRVRDDGKVV